MGLGPQQPGHSYLFPQEVENLWGLLDSGVSTEQLWDRGCKSQQQRKEVIISAPLEERISVGYINSSWKAKDKIKKAFFQFILAHVWVHKVFRYENYSCCVNSSTLLFLRSKQLLQIFFPQSLAQTVPIMWNISRTPHVNIYKAMPIWCEPLCYEVVFYGKLQRTC